MIFRRALQLCSTVAVVLLCLSPVAARTIWTDVTGDGVPDGGGPGTPIAVGDTVLVDVWIDSETLTWQAFWLVVGWPQACFSRAGMGLYLSENGVFQITYDDSLGLLGSGFSESGIDRIGWVKLRCDAASDCCVEPILNPQPFQLTSWIQSSGTRYYFASRDVSCFGQASTATESSSWGQVKGLFR